jgi:hypothetical protein
MKMSLNTCNSSACHDGFTWFVKTLACQRNGRKRGVAFTFGVAGHEALNELVEEVLYLLLFESAALHDYAARLGVHLHHLK